MPDTELILNKIHENINQRLSEGDEADTMLNFIFSSLLDKIPYDRMGIAVISEKEQSLNLRWVQSRFPSDYLTKGYSVALDQTRLHEVIKLGSPEIIEDLAVHMARYPGSVTSKNALREGVRSNLLIPIKLDNVHAGMVFFSSKNLNTYNLEHIRYYNAIANQIAVIIEHERLVEISRSRNFGKRNLNLIVHDLRNPLGVFSTCLQLIRQRSWFKEIPADSVKLFDVLDRTHRSMLHLVNELWECGQFDLTQKPCKMVPVFLRPYFEILTKKTRSNAE